MSDVLEPAPTGRAKCRGCGNAIAQGELRFGERDPNPFGEGDATFWFHPACAARRRPERFVALDDAQKKMVPGWAELQAVAEQGVAHPRLPRIAGRERAKSGRATCRHCKKPIAADTERIVLSIWEEARFSPMGFIHEACVPDYFGVTDIEPWLHLR